MPNAITPATMVLRYMARAAESFGDLSKNCAENGRSGPEVDEDNGGIAGSVDVSDELDWLGGRSPMVQLRKEKADLA